MGCVYPSSGSLLEGKVILELQASPATTQKVGVSVCVGSGHSVFTDDVTIQAATNSG